MGGRLLSVNVARVQTFRIDGRDFVSGIGKRPVDGPVVVRPLGLEDDEQADGSVHGGLSKALYAYPHEHYAFWQTVRAQARVAGWDQPVPFGLLGENLTLEGLIESQAFVGDVLRFPYCERAISEPRFPCFKFGAAMGFAPAVKLMQSNAWCGFYLAVRSPGTLCAGERFELVAGPRDVGITELFRARTAASRR